jgi:hypothetical protein
MKDIADIMISDIYLGVHMKFISCFSGAAFAASLLVGGAAQAAIVTGLTNTGVNLIGNVDQSWSIVSGSSYPGLTYPSNAYTNTANGTFPIGPWISNTAISAWDTPTDPLTSNLDPSANGLYSYQTTFNISGAVSPGAGFLSGVFAADNEVSSITLNGVTIYTGPTDGSSLAYPLKTDTY